MRAVRVPRPGGKEVVALRRDYRDTAHRVTLIGFCRHLRAASTDAEQKLWQLLRGRRMSGFKFRRQHQFGPYVLDFFCPERGLAIEVDGNRHFESDVAVRDAARTCYLEAAGIRILRFTNVDMLKQGSAVAEVILRELDHPHPDPLPEGEGVAGVPLPEGEGVAGVPLPEGEGLRVVTPGQERSPLGNASPSGRGRPQGG